MSNFISNKAQVKYNNGKTIESQETKTYAGQPVKILKRAFTEFSDFIEEAGEAEELGNITYEILLENFNLTPLYNIAVTDTIDLKQDDFSVRSNTEGVTIEKKDSVKQPGKTDLTFVGVPAELKESQIISYTITLNPTAKTEFTNKAEMNYTTVEAPENPSTEESNLITMTQVPETAHSLELLKFGPDIIDCNTVFSYSIYVVSNGMNSDNIVITDQLPKSFLVNSTGPEAYAVTLAKGTYIAGENGEKGTLTSSSPVDSKVTLSAENELTIESKDSATPLSLEANEAFEVTITGKFECN